MQMNIRCIQITNSTREENKEEIKSLFEKEREYLSSKLLYGIGFAVKSCYNTAKDTIVGLKDIGEYGLVVVGSPPLRPEPGAGLGEVVGRLLASPSTPSVLIVRSTP